MADKAAQVKIGHYILGETLGVGTFGKVKSVFSSLCSLVFFAMITDERSQQLNPKAAFDLAKPVSD